jgi:hypothetical protein
MHAPSVRGVIESMNGARFVHDTLEELHPSARSASSVVALRCNWGTGSFLVPRITPPCDCRAAIAPVWTVD